MDGQPFELRSFTGKLLANTAGAGGSFEIMPQLNGQDAFPNPLMFDATGYAGNTFAHNPALSGYDTYTIHLWVDYALIQLTVADASLPPTLDISFPATNQVRLSWPTNSSGYSLQQNPSLDPGTWSAVTNSAGISGSNYELTLPRQGAAEFFRLILP